jgi:hypothetical protein
VILLRFLDTFIDRLTCAISGCIPAYYLAKSGTHGLLVPCERCGRVWLHPYTRR